MAMRRTAWLLGVLLVGAVLSLFLPLVGGIAFLLAVPVAFAGPILTRQRPIEPVQRDGAERLMAAIATLTARRTPSDDPQVNWGAAMRAELATITKPRERRRFALGAAVALLGRPHTLKSVLLAVGVALAFGAGLLGISRAALGDDGLLTVTLFPPMAMLFAVGYLCARSTRSLRFGLDTGILAVLTTLVAVAVVNGVEAAHWYDIAPAISVLDGEPVSFDSTRAAVLDAMHPIILLIHLGFWLPWPILGAVVGARAPRAATG